MRFLLERNLSGEVHHPREPIYKDDDTYLEPDMMYVSPTTVTIEVRHAAEHKGKPVWKGQSYSQGEMVESRVLQGWRVSVDELFEGLI